MDSSLTEGYKSQDLIPNCITHQSNSESVVLLCLFSFSWTEVKRLKYQCIAQFVVVKQFQVQPDNIGQQQVTQGNPEAKLVNVQSSLTFVELLFVFLWYFFLNMNLGAELE